jgi:hypothetical protein
MYNTEHAVKVRIVHINEHGFAIDEYGLAHDPRFLVEVQDVS